MRVKLIETALGMSDSGLSPGRSGNISTRYKTGFLITPSAMAYDQIVEDDIVFLKNNGKVKAGSRRPSSEWLFHAQIYQNFDHARAVLHCHSQYATTLACLGLSIPAFHYMIAVAGGHDIRCCNYATFGSEKLAQLVIEALNGRQACLLGNHGQLAYSDSLDSVFELASEVENLSRLYWNILQVGEPILLDDAEMDRVLEKFKNYRAY